MTDPPPAGSPDSPKAAADAGRRAGDDTGVDGAWAEGTQTEGDPAEKARAEGDRAEKVRAEAAGAEVAEGSSTADASSPGAGPAPGESPAIPETHPTSEVSEVSEVFADPEGSRGPEGLESAQHHVVHQLARLGAVMAATARPVGRWTRARARTGRGRVGLAALVAVLLAVPSVLGLTLATALDDDDPDSGGGVTRVATLGVMAPLSGDLSVAGGSVRDAVELAVNEANKSGAIPGWKIEMSARDDLSRPDGGAEAADAFATNDRVIGVVGPLSSIVAKVSLPTLSAAGVPVVSPSNADPGLTNSGAKPRTRPFPSYFRLSGTDDLQARAAAEYAVRTLGRTRLAVVDSGPTYGTTLGARFAVQAADLGATVTSVHQAEEEGAGGSEIKEMALAISNEAPDLVYVAAGPVYAGKLRAQLADLGMSVQVLGSDGLLQSRYLDEATSAAEGDVITSLLVPPIRLPSSGAFVAAYSDRFGGPAGDDGETSPKTSPDAESPEPSGPSPRTGPPRGEPAPAEGSSARDPGAASAPTRVGAGTGADEEPPDASGREAPVAVTDSGGKDATGRQRAAREAAAALAVRRAEAIPAVAAYAYDAARAIIRAAATVLPGRTVIDDATRHDLVAAIGRGSFAGVTGAVAFDRWGDVRSPTVVIFTVLGGRFVPLKVET